MVDKRVFACIVVTCLKHATCHLALTRAPTIWRWSDDRIRARDHIVVRFAALSNSSARKCRTRAGARNKNAEENAEHGFLFKRKRWAYAKKVYSSRNCSLWVR
jgi:hypothetical protein